MFSLPFIKVLVLFASVSVYAQNSPHGEKLNTECNVCHTTKNWSTIVINRGGFNHDKTDFPLVGLHRTVACRKCHINLNFNNIKGNTECISCHIDIHLQTLGKDCRQCHTPEEWAKTKFDHSTSRFKLDGAHATAKCIECHKQITDEKGKYVQYKFKNIECSNCHS